MIVLLCGWPSVGADDEPRVVLLIDDRARLSSRIVEHAAKEAVRIYRHAGVKMAWRTATGADVISGRANSGEEFSVRLIVQAKFRGLPDANSRFIMGAAPALAAECGGIVYLFFDQIREAADVQQLDTGVLFGTVAAHEVGHLLLRLRGHSAEGLMRAAWRTDDWQRAASGLLLFSPSEGATIRRTIAACR